MYQRWHSRNYYGLCEGTAVLQCNPVLHIQMVKENSGCRQLCAVVADVIADLPHTARQKQHHTTPQQQLDKLRLAWMQGMSGKSCKVKQKAILKGIPGDMAVTRYTTDATSIWLVLELLWTLHKPGTVGRQSQHLESDPLWTQIAVSMAQCVVNLVAPSGKQDKNLLDLDTLVHLDYLTKFL